MARANTWVNSDGLPVGFGRNVPENIKAGEVLDFGDNRVQRLQFTFQSTFGASGAMIQVPAGCIVKNVYLHVVTAFTGGTSLAFGDATTPAGWITATQAAVANLTTNASIQAGGTYAIATGTSATAPKVYTAATNLYLTAVGTFTSGSAEIIVEYAPIG